MNRPTNNLGYERLLPALNPLCAACYRAITSSEVLPISRDDFRPAGPCRPAHLRDRAQALRPTGILARGIGALAKKVGSKQAEKHFNAHLRNLVAAITCPTTR